jgi:hypothetical protein
MMDEEIFEVTPTVALKVTTALFFELAAMLDRAGALSGADLGRNLIAASDDAQAAHDERGVIATLRSVGEQLVRVSGDTAR